MSSLFNKLSEGDLEKVGCPTPVLSEIFKILKPSGSSLRLEELCEELIELYTGEKLRNQFKTYKHLTEDIDDNRKILEDEKVTDEEKKVAKDHYDFARIQLEREIRKLTDLIKISIESKVPLGAYSEKIADSEISTKYVRGFRQLEDLSSSLLYIFAKHPKEINYIRWMGNNDPTIYGMKPLRVLFYSEDKEKDSLLHFLKDETQMIESLADGQKSLKDGLHKLFNDLPFFDPKNIGNEIYLDMSVDIINIFYKTNLKIFNNKESEARDEVANQLIQIFTSDLAENPEEKHYHEQLAIILSFILKNIKLDDVTKVPKLDVERVYIMEDEECKKISNIANYLILPKLFGHHGNVKVSIADVRNTLKLYFSLRRAKLFGLRNIRLKDDKGRITTTMIEEPKVGSLIYETLMIVQEHLKKKVFRDYFWEGLGTQTW